MKKLSMVLMAYFLVMSLLGATKTFATNETPAPADTTKQTEEVKLTEAQKGELAKLHKNLLEQKKQLIQKYVEFNVLPKEKGDEMIQRYEEHYKMLEENGFIYKGGPGKGHHGPHNPERGMN